MAPQSSIPVAANVLGTMGTVLWCVQLVPQIWYNWKQKKTDGLPGIMMFTWATSAVPFGVYAVVQVRTPSKKAIHADSREDIDLLKNFNIPIQVQPQVFGTLSLGPYIRGVSWPVTLIGIIAAILLAAGLIPPYFEFWKRGGRVVGIMAQSTFDVLGGILYIIVLLLELGIFASHLAWRFRTRKLHQQAKLQGRNFDDLPEAKKYQISTDRGAKSVQGDLEKGGSEGGNVGTSPSQDRSAAGSLGGDGEREKGGKKNRWWFHF
ncbi:MAG: hypothetical protein Q9191_005009 [Dirinaria sp. TL-2023a]